MKRFLLLALCIVALGARSAPPVAAQAKSPSNLTNYKLPNGLELHVFTDNSLPLARVQIVFRAGAIAQTAETAGLFRLYERLVLGGNAVLPGSATVASALAELGLSEWEGGCSAERMSYWFALPSSRTEDGIKFWAAALKAPLLDPAALEIEKANALRDLKASVSDPDSVFEAAFNRRLFGKFPWRRDPLGSEKVLRSANVESLRALQKRWLVPNNAAVFVGGAVDPEQVRDWVEKAFGDWAGADDPWKKAIVPNPKPGVVRPTWIVYPDPSIPEGLAFVEARYRGPDLPADQAASFGADLWCALVADPQGRFKTELMKNVAGLYGKETISANYASQRDGGTISISAYFATDPSKPAVDRARAFKERARGYEITAMKTENGYFSARDYESARKRLADERLIALDSVDGMIDSLAFWWATASTDYFLGYPAAIAKAGPKEVGAFIDAYIMRNLEVVGLRMNPADYEKEKRSFENSGFEVVGSANSFWWER